LSPVSFCSFRGPPGALDSDVYWPAQLCYVWCQDLEPTTNDTPITRTVALFVQAKAQHPPVQQQVWVSCTIARGCCDCTVSLAPTTNVQTRLDPYWETDGASQNNHQCLYTHTHPFSGPLSRTTRVSRYQKGKTNLDFTEARDNGIT